MKFAKKARVKSNKNENVIHLQLIKIFYNFRLHNVNY